ncbi:hypothetical protein [Pseudonocardia xishanensis]|uniref:Luciferase-like monooxygenase n=1 Tax=Pseudonocardia xishanensis TaxID=630995 RepID=A0ABP8RQL4_9PSEU
MRLGLSAPVVVHIPSASRDWEKTAGIAEIAGFAVAADRLDFEYLTCSDHVG